LKIFYDSEFTGLHRSTSLISLALIDENGRAIYCEFTDYDKSQVNDWLRENVISKLFLTKSVEVIANPGGDLHDWRVYVKGDTKFIQLHLKKWLSSYQEVLIWSDVYAYDWVLFNELLASYECGYPQLPMNVNYIPRDIATVMDWLGIDPDINREEFAGLRVTSKHKHTALHDAIVIKACYEVLGEMYSRLSGG
jgi:hypothetical protein